MRSQRSQILTMIILAQLIFLSYVKASVGVVKSMVIQGPTDRIQLIESRKNTESDSRRSFDTDQTGTARIEIADPSILKADPQGGLMGLADGLTTATVTTDLGKVEYHITVKGFTNPETPKFETDIQPILTRLGCNSGPCHGKQRGQNGFQLSLFGFDPEFDYNAIALENRGRRVFAASPQNSLLLMKGTAMMPHGGGKRLEPESPYYETILNWIQAGLPHSDPNAPKPVSVRVEPSNLTLKPKSAHQVRVLATYSDKSVRDVTHLSAFSSSDSVIAATDESGLVTAGPLPGEVAITARFENLFGSCETTIPLPGSMPENYYRNLPRHNEIDELVYGRLEKLGIAVSEPADDSTFLRRVSLDIIGRLPTPEETLAFLADDCTEKRENLVDRLLERPEYADHWAMKWVDLLRPNPYRVGIKAVINLDAWIREQFRKNTPYDQFVYKILTASGSTFDVTPATIFRDRREPEEITTVVSQLFLGIRLECAKCHHHPFEVWSQEDFYGLAAHFAQIKRKGTGLSPPISGSEEVVFSGNSGTVSHPRTGETVPPKPLIDWITKSDQSAESEVKTDSDQRDLRTEFAKWVTAPENPFFGQVIANRVWADLMGRGIVEPVDDIRATNPPSNPELLDWLSKDFRSTGHDLKHLIRKITTSYVYGLSSQPVERNTGDTRLFSRHYRTRLKAETLLDAVSDVTAVSESFSGAPPETRAVALWTFRTPNVFLDTFGRPDPNQDPPCERSPEGSVTQALHLMNAPKLQEKLQAPDGTVSRLTNSEMTPDEIIENIYLRCLSRKPTSLELEKAKTVFSDPESLKAGSKLRRTAIEDLLWVLLNTAEFVFKN